MGKQKVFLTMPLVMNVPNPADSTWKETTCKFCGNECWDRPTPKELAAVYEVEKACTMCALRMGGK